MLHELLDDLSHHFPEDSLALKPPISTEEKETLAQSLLDLTGFELPTPILDLFSWHNGQALRGKSLFPCYRHLISSSRMLAICREGMSVLYDLEMSKFVDKTVQQQASSIHDTRIRSDRFWQKGWFPFGEGSGKTLIVDCEPTTAGKFGQVILWDHFGPFGMVVGYSLQDYLERTIAAINGQKISSTGFFVDYSALADA